MNVVASPQSHLANKNKREARCAPLAATYKYNLLYSINKIVYDLCLKKSITLKITFPYLVANQSNDKKLKTIL